MLPLQDVVPTHRVPISTLVLIGLNVAVFGAQLAGAANSVMAAPFTHAGAGLLVIAVVALWLFGDHVEARLGRAVFTVVYLMGGWLTGMAGTGAVTAVLGSYFVLLPRSRVLTLVPLPPLLVEVPAAFFLGVWTVLHMVQFVNDPRTLWAYALAFLWGALVARWRRRPIRW